MKVGKDLISPGMKVSETTKMDVVNWRREPVKTLISIRDNAQDQLNFSLPLDFYLAEKWKTIETHHNVYLLSNEPFQISGNVAIPKPNVAQIAMLLDQHQHLLH